MEVDGIISARSKKNTVNESRIEMDKDTCKENRFNLIQLIAWPHFLSTVKLSQLSQSFAKNEYVCYRKNSNLQQLDHDG